VVAVAAFVAVAAVVVATGAGAFVAAARPTFVTAAWATFVTAAWATFVAAFFALVAVAFVVATAAHAVVARRFVLMEAGAPGARPRPAGPRDRAACAEREECDCEECRQALLHERSFSCELCR
jgi:hypothetical protein